ncbi:MAG TPA: phosphoglycolate phosphatase [Eoetvoesiella sp.]|uniref:phosphoglycolate phosphatase n=1 Tax=Eoetvoesiella sp. TaxID=1966355 RepID=UPI002B62DABB|nr:phosphoglycolate phosphatase [Eoetvoesiella sp.]HWK60438.1 phosphoglycolate phosphatase [Eoetvoesiella sp.]
MPYTAVLLDLDGTLLDTIPDLADATNAMLADLGLAQLSQETVASLVGKGTKALIASVLARQGKSGDQTLLQERAQALFRQHYHRFNGQRAVLYAGVEQGLRAFARMGLKLAVVTNKPTEFTLPLLERSGLAPYFECVVCGDTCPEQKPQPAPLLHACAQLGAAPGQAVMIGDSINDAQAAQAAGIAALAVPYGYNHGQDVQNLKVDDIVMSIEAAAQWISKRRTGQGQTALLGSA